LAASSCFWGLVCLPGALTSEVAAVCLEGVRDVPHSSPVHSYARRLLPILALATLLPDYATVQGQEAPVFSADSELVVLQVTVKDRKGAYVDDLPEEAFSVVEDGRAQTVRFFTDTDTPVTVGLLIDSSGSMHANRPLVAAAAAAFADASHPRDEIFALAFNENVSPALSPGAPFTNDGTVLRAALERSISARGRTALYDAISTGVDYLSRGSRQRKALVVVSDGGDNASKATREEAVRKAQASSAVIYTLALVDSGSRDANPRLLKELAEASGGESFRPDRPREIVDVLSRIARDIRHAYTVGYTPTNTARDGAFRSVRIVVTAPPGRRLVVRSRAGYLAGTSP
jgi:Ca-activated chloride channel family protein